MLSTEATMTTTVKVSSRYQIAVPKLARQLLGIERGDRLLVEVKRGILLLVPEPKDYVAHLAGLHRQVWEGVETEEYLRGEREAWTESARR
jgi:AbrB family looped-hinge helix DNA binding protein